MTVLNQDGERVSGEAGFFPESKIAGTFFGPVFDRLDFMAVKLTGLVGAASGTPDTQSVIYSLQHDDLVGFGSPEDVPATVGAALAALTGDDERGNGNFNLNGAKQFCRVKAVVAFTGGSSPEQLIAAALEFMGALQPPTSD